MGSLGFTWQGSLEYAAALNEVQVQGPASMLLVGIPIEAQAPASNMLL